MISIIIPSFNHLEDCLKPCIESLIKQTDMSDKEVIVVANGCTDGTEEYVKSLGDPFKLVSFPAAIGYPRAINEGIKISTGSFVILLNNDVILMPQIQNDWVMRLIKPFLEDKDMGITGSLIQPCPWADGREFMVFSNVMVSRKVIDKIGLLDEGFGIGTGEDVDYSFRAVDAGFKLRCVTKQTDGFMDNGRLIAVNDFPTYHAGRATIGAMPGMAELFTKNMGIIKERYSKKIKVSIVLPTYNHLNDCLIPCIESILKYTDLSQAEIIVSANGCKDGTKEYLKTLPPQFKTVWNDEPVGYTRATNDGIDAAKGEYLVLLNNDTVLLPQPVNQWIDIMMQPFLDNQLMAITGPSMNTDGNSQRQFIIFFCAMIKRSVYDHVGKLDEIFSPGFGEDTDWCARAEDMGYIQTQVPTNEALKHGGGKLMVGNFPIYHAGEATFGEDDTVFQALIKKNSQTLKDRYFHTLPSGYFSQIDIDVYQSFVGRHPKGSRIAEIGTWKGRSLCSVAQLIKDNNLEVVAIDGFYGTPSEGKTTLLVDTGNIQAILEANLNRFGIRDKTRVIKGDSAQSANLFPDKHFECVFIDADHSYEAVKKDLAAWWPKVKGGGILCGHDYMWAGVRQALEEKFGAFAIHTNLANMWYVDKPKVYDCFMFANELDVLEIRMNELKDVVDHFVVAEAPTSQSGVVKALHLTNNMARFDHFGDQLRVIVVNDMPAVGDAWARERHQRDAVMRGLTDMRDCDIVIITDADEIPKPEAIMNYKQDQGCCSMLQQMSYYYVNCFSSERWNWPKILTWREMKHMTPCQVRYLPNTGIIKDGGWHFSFLGGIDKIIEKIKAYAHQEYNTPEFLDPKRLLTMVQNGEDIFGRGTKYITAPIDNTYPKYLVSHKSKYNHLICPIRKTNTVTAVVSTKNRYYTTLPLTVLSIMNQSVKVDKLVIYDDGEHKDLREDPLWKNILMSIQAKGIEWTIVFGEGKGQVLNHQKSIDSCTTDWIWRLDDDNYAEYDCLENLLAAADSATGAVGGLVIDPKHVTSCSMASNKIEDIYVGLNQQWFLHEGISEVDHLYSTFIYRKTASGHGYCKELSVVGHREETLFTYEMKRNGWKIKINPAAVTWHYKNSEGGIRTFRDPNLWAWDDSVMAYKFKQWGVVTNDHKMIALDSGLGDHLAFLKALPEIKAKHKNLTLAVCYPEVFKDHPDVKLISINEAKAMGSIDDHSIYKFMWDNEKTPMNLVEAFRRKFA
jgi:beta-1,4-mannosyl-glycoprotein beta-1,4-N-acetylglucosaminyltransferase